MMNQHSKLIIASVSLVLLAAINIGGTHAVSIPDDDHIYVLKERPEINRLKVNDFFAIKLKENISTGYSWQYKVSNPGIIKFLELTRKELKKFKVVGAQTEAIWKFQATGTGESRIDFKYYRTWEGEKTAKESRIYDVIIVNE